MTQGVHHPIFIGGLFKSGTSLLRAMLGQHSAIAAGLESYWFDLDWSGPRNEKFHDHIERLRKFYNMEKGSLQVMVEESKTALDFLNRFMSSYAARMGKHRWVEKTPGNILYIREILTEFSDAKIIHIIRDPKDVLASLRQARKWDTVPIFVEMWCRFLGTAIQLEKELSLTSENILTIRYEALIIDPAAVMRHVIDFLDEEWEDHVASFAGKKGEYEKVLEVTGKASTTLYRLSKPLSKDRIGVWRKVLSDGEVEAIREGVRKKGLLPVFSRIEKETPSL